MKPNWFVALGAALWLGHAAPSIAAQTTTQMNVSLTKVQAAVTVSANSMNFGTVADPGDVESATTITVNATQGVPYTIAIDRGGASGAPATARFMNTGMGSIPYYLYSDPGRTAVWGDDGVTIPAPSLSSMGNGLDVLYMVYGRATVPNPGPPPGDYTDVVTVSVLF